MPLTQTKIYRRGIPPNPPLTPRAVVAGTGGQIHTIERGQTTAAARASGTTSPIHTGIWTGQSYLLGSAAGDLLYSADGISWSIRRSGNAKIIAIIHNGYGRVVCFFEVQSSNIYYIRSEDYGFTWTTYASIPASGSHGGQVAAIYNPYRNEVLVAYSRNISGSVAQGVMYEILNFETLNPIGKTVNSVSNADGYAFYFQTPTNPGMFSPIDNSYWYWEWNNINYFWTRRDPVTLARSRVFNPSVSNQGIMGQASTLYTDSSSVRIAMTVGAPGASNTKQIRTSTDMANYPVTANLANIYIGIAFAWNANQDYVSGGVGQNVLSNQPGCHIAWNGVSPTFIFLSSYGTGKSVGPYCAII